jgi:DNA-binding CsgD family transcriptional regulator
MTKKYPEDRLNYLAVDLLETFGNQAPTQGQIDLMERILSNVVMQGRISIHQDLTDREKECLYLAAKGLSAPQTAEVLSLETSTINSHRSKLKRKLDCDTMSQAVFEGIRYGHIGQEETRESRKNHET